MQDNYGIKKLKNGIYKGSIIAGKRTGKGIIIRDNEIIEGDFIDGVLNGYMKITRNNGDTYEGEVKNNKNHGFGKSVRENGTEIYEGEFFEGQRHGKGVLIEGNKKSEGTFVNGVPNGQFKKYEKVNQEWRIIFEGNVVNDAFHGICTQYIQGVKIQCELNHGKTEKIYEFDAKDYKYVGDFVEGMNGTGILYKNGLQYSGNFISGVLEGWGKMIDHENIYEGNFISGKLHRCGNIKGQMLPGGKMHFIYHIEDSDSDSE